jgi:hypothetical protein
MVGNEEHWPTSRQRLVPASEEGPDVARQQRTGSVDEAGTGNVVVKRSYFCGEGASGAMPDTPRHGTEHPAAQPTERLGKVVQHDPGQAGHLVVHGAIPRSKGKRSVIGTVPVAKA